MKYTPHQWLQILIIKNARNAIRYARKQITDWQREIDYQERNIELAIEEIKRINKWEQAA